MRITVSSNGICSLVVGKKKENVGPFLGRQEGARKKKSQQYPDHESAGYFFPIGFNFPVFDEFPCPVGHVLDTAKSLGKLKDLSTVLSKKQGKHGILLGFTQPIDTISMYKNFRSKPMLVLVGVGIFLSQFI